MNLIGNWNYPTSVRFGAGRIRELGAAVKAAGMARPLLVTDASLARMPIVERAMQALADEGVAATLFCDVQPNPVAANVEAGLKALSGGQHDGVVAFGGGSSLDAGKVIAFMAGQTRPMWDFEDVGDWWTRAEATGILPIVAVPTTAGTGSEVGRAGVITDAVTQQKKVIFHPLMMPKTSICDPELTLGMPPSTTAGTGMDALAHCLEAYSGAAYHPLADGIAAEGIRLVKENLIRAYRDGSDLAARAHMMSAALMGATAFQKALGSDPCPVASRWRALRYPPWPDQCGLHAVRAQLQSGRDRGQNCAPCRLPRIGGQFRCLPVLGAGAQGRDRRSAHPGGPRG